jgi:uncharacterized protein (TIGR02680 family)
VSAAERGLPERTGNPERAGNSQRAGYSERAGAHRWQPTRAGLINVWRFQEETFEFHRGRLLLRGPNGAGKSMALELLFPFLLDADAHPAKLTSGIKMRGGLFERVITGTDHPTRVGFVWAEFHRGDEVFTIGARLRASQASRKAEADWFTSRRAVGDGLELLDADRVALSKAALALAVGEGGTLHPSAQDYRDTVRRSLFPGFSPAQYDALVTALISLRREKISQDLSPTKLSEVLTASLPALDEKDVSEIAEGFERLDRRREELARLESDLTQVRDLERRQRDYARRVVLSGANAVRAAESDRDRVTRQEREAREALVEAGARRERCLAETAAAELRVQELATELDTLRSLDAYREGSQLEEVQRTRGRLARQARDEAGRVEGRRRVAEERSAGRDGLAGRLAAAEADLHRALADLNAAAESLGAAAVVADAGRLGDADEAEGLLCAWSANRRAQLAEVRAALDELQERIRTRSIREEAVERERELLEQRAAQRAEAAAEVELAEGDYRQAVRSWVAGSELLDPAALAAELPSPPLDPAAVTAAIARVAASALSALAGERARTEAAAEALRVEREVLSAERDELSAGRTPSPDPPAWRSERDRPGAPLWRLVDFAGHCSAAERDGVEAALLASGLLDAWVAADGSLSLPAGVADVLASGPPLPGGAGTTTLLEALVLNLDGEVPPEAVLGLLGSIALVDRDAALPGATAASDAAAGTAGTGAAPGAAAIGRDGSFRLGPLTGRGPAQPARFIGAAAQERERQRRIAQLTAGIAAIDLQLRRLAGEVESLVRRRQGIAAEVALAPDGTALLAARRRFDDASLLLDEVEGRLRAAERRRLESEQAVRQAQAALMHLATRHSLPTDAAALERYDDHLRGFELAAGTWARRGRSAARLSRELAWASAEADRAGADLAEAEQRRAEVDRDLREVVVRLETLESGVGAAYREVVARIDAARAERQNLEARGRELAGERAGLERQVGALEERVADAERRRDEEETKRDRAHRSFVAVVADGYGDDAGAEISRESLDGLTGVLDAARALAARFPQTDAGEPAVKRAQNSVMEGYHLAGQTLRGRIDLTFEETETGFWLLRAATDGVRSRVPQLVARMAEQVRLAHEELTEEERRLFDETLTGSLRAAVAERIRQANALIDQINVALAAVRTDAAGVAVRLRWDVDPDQPYASGSVRSLLLKDAAGYSDSERESLHDFFRGRLDQVRSELEGSAGWEERLREVLDYRQWHRFALELAHRDWDGFQPATGARLQRLSTGERSIALHLPMLASITAHYDGSGGTGAGGCPRLILLDELFAGVDQDNRGQLFGLFVAWDLDAVFTSDHEWCAYATLDGIAIHHLHGAGGSDGEVVSSRFVWNGRRRVPAPAGWEQPAEPAPA